jgi:hypothetical protein
MIQPATDFLEAVMKYRAPIITAGFVMLFSMTGFAADDATEAASAPVAKKPVQCETVTGSRIRAAQTATGCDTRTKPFRTYTQEDLERTGDIDLTEALRKLDPIFR